MYSVSPDSRLLVLLRTTKLWPLFGRYILTVVLVSCFVCMYVRVCFCMCSSIYIVCNRGKTVAHQKLLKSNLFSFTNCFSRQRFAWRESPSPFSIDPGCLATGKLALKGLFRYFNKSVWGSWHVRCASPKEQEDIHESVVHSACWLNSVGNTILSIVRQPNLKKVEKKLSEVCW